MVAFVVNTTGAPTQVQCRSASDTAFAVVVGDTKADPLGRGVWVYSFREAGLL